MKKTILIITSFLLLGQFVLAQQNEVDSLINQLRQNIDQQEKVDVLLSMSRAVLRTNPDSTIQLGQEALELAQSLNYQAGTALAFKNIGLGQYFKGNYRNATENWSSALEVYRLIDDQVGVSNMLSNIGAIYYNQGNDVKALEYYLESLKVSELLNDKPGIARALSNIGAAYDIKKAKSDEALEYYFRALPIFEEIEDRASYAITLGNIGSIYFEDLNRYDSAQIFFRAAQQVNEEIGIEDPYLITSLGRAIAEQGDYAEALTLQQRAFRIADSRGAKLEKGQALLSLGETNRKSGNPKLALSYLEKADTLAREIRSLTLKELIYKEMVQAYADLDQYRKAFEAQNLLAQVEDSIYNLENDRRIEGLQFQFDLEKKDAQIELQQAEIQRASILRNFLFATAIFLIITVAGVSYSYWFARRSNRIITEERNRSESILLNILPEETAEELKHNGKVKAKRFEQVSVMFTDFREFTEVSKGVPPEEIVKSVDYYFRNFDEIISSHNLEKIKTIGDAYMCAGGLPIPNATHPQEAVAAGLDIIEFVENTRAYPPEGIITFDIRVGIHTGPVVAGVVGTKKFQYDIWGSTVNLASMMETNSEPNRLNISNGTYELIKDRFTFEYRGEITGKHGGKYKMYFVGEPVSEPETVA